MPIRTAPRRRGGKTSTTGRASRHGRSWMPSPYLTVPISGISMKNPPTLRSGTYGHHGNFSQFFPVEIMGVLVPKPIRTYRWPGNPAPRTLETPAGLHTSVGIPCNSWDYFIEHDVPILRSLNVPIIQSVIG